MKGKIDTDKGTMVLEFFEKDAPNTVNNFVKLSSILILLRMKLSKLASILSF